MASVKTQDHSFANVKCIVINVYRSYRLLLFSFYRAIERGYAAATVCRPSVRPSVRLSVCDVEAP